MFKKIFYIVGLLATAAAFGNEERMSIKENLHIVQLLLKPRSGRDPRRPYLSQLYLNQARSVIEATVADFAAYKMAHPFDAGNPALCAEIQKASSQLLPKYEIQDNNNSFLS